ncbi:MAG: hypothetical protein IT290_04655 [Deltaproteobacteria bacterium]|nr:hypothetical protein [Deltaproteobacteria bacterium]
MKFFVQGLHQITKRVIFGIALCAVQIPFDSLAETKRPSPAPTPPRSTAERNRDAAMQLLQGREAPPAGRVHGVDPEELNVEVQQDLQRRRLELENDVEKSVLDGAGAGH